MPFGFRISDLERRFRSGNVFRMSVKEYEVGAAAGGELRTIELIFGIGMVMREGRTILGFGL